MAVSQTTDQTFAADVEQGGLVLVDFWAPWCGPCRMVAPVLDQLAEEFAGKVKIVKLNVDENPETSSRFGVMSIPTLLLFKDGQVVDKIVGYQPKENFVNMLNKHL